MFLTFFPMMLLVLAVASGSQYLRSGIEEMTTRLGPLLPPGAEPVLKDFLTRHGAHPIRWAVLGLAGTLVAGTQMMKLLTDGFEVTSGRSFRTGFWKRHIRALLLLCVTFVPWVITAGLTVFGRQLRTWMIHRFGAATLIRGLWVVVFTAGALAIAMLVLSVIYRLGCPGSRRWKDVLPGAIVATLFWWLVSWSFGLYMRHVPYGLIYGGLAVAIGLMLWMQLTAVIIFLGAGFNAEYRPGEG